MCGGPLKCGGPCSAEHVRTLVNPALCNVASRVTKSLEAPKKGIDLRLFVSSVDKNPLHALFLTH